MTLDFAAHGPILTDALDVYARSLVRGADDNSLGALAQIAEVRRSVATAQAQDALDAAAERKATADAAIQAVVDAAVKADRADRRARDRKAAKRAIGAAAVPMLSGDGAATAPPVVG